MDFLCGHEPRQASAPSCGCGQRVFVQEQLFDGRFAHFLFVAMDLHELLETTVTGLGYELVDVEQSPRGRVLRVFIDKLDKPGGIDVEDCALVSNQLSRVLAVENVDYDRLEVSSPGLDRPLKKLTDYERFAGQDIQLRLRLPVNNQRNFVGTLVAVQDGVIELRSETAEHRFPFDDIEKARLVPRF